MTKRIMVVGAKWTSLPGANSLAISMIRSCWNSYVSCAVNMSETSLSFMKSLQKVVERRAYFFQRVLKEPGDNNERAQSLKGIDLDLGKELVVVERLLLHANLLCSRHIEVTCIHGTYTGASCPQ